MRKNPSQFAVAAALLLSVLILAACNCSPTLRYVTVAPTSSTISVGSTQQFTATTYYSNGSIQDATATANWASSNNNVATVAAGLATAVGGGTTTISASAGGQIATATLTVTAPLAITSTGALAGATLGSSYSEDVTATGGVTPYTWTLKAGSSLPAGLTLTSGTPSATITGKPTATGTFQFTLQVADSTSPTPLTTTANFLITVTGSTALNCPTTVNLTLCGSYALGLRGFNSSGPVVAGIIFVANNSGNIISGTKEINQTGSTPAALAITGGSYAMDSSGDGRGVVTLIDSKGASATYRFALESSANPGPAPAEQFDSSGILAAGTLVGPFTAPVPQLPANLILAAPLEGINGSGQRAALFGEYQIGSSGCDGTTGSLKSVAGEPVVSNTVGTVNSSLTVTGSCTASDPNTGIGTAQITISGGTPFTNSTLNFIYVTIGSGTTIEAAFFLETDAIAANQPILNGLAFPVTVPTGGFNATSLGCPCILYQGGLTNGTTKSGHSVASLIRLLTTPGTGASGTLTGIADENSGGTITLDSAIGPYNYNVDANGVGTISASSTIHFIISNSEMMTLDESTSVLTGSFRAQNATSLANTGVPYIVGMGNGDLEGVNPNVAQAVGVVTPSGATSGTLTGTVDVISSTGPVAGVTASGTYTIDANGRGTGNANFSGGTSGVSTVMYVRRVREFIILDVQSTDPYLLGARLQ
jgi:Putative Ig domain/Bacterial Ig-like domain (group 2)